MKDKEMRATMWVFQRFHIICAFGAGFIIAAWVFTIRAMYVLDQGKVEFCQKVLGLR